MGFVDRLGKIFGGAKDALGDVGGAATDVASAFWDLGDLQFDGREGEEGFGTALRERFMVRAADFGKNALGGIGEGTEDRGLGAVTGSIPGANRAIRTVGRGAETVSREAIHEPAATVITAFNLGDSPTWQREHGITDEGPFELASFPLLFKPETWRKAHELAQSTSFGQAVAIGLGSEADILKPDTFRKTVNTEWFRWTSGTMDALLRLGLDADVLAGRGLAAGRRSLLTRPVDRAAREAFFSGGGKMREMLGATWDDVSGQIRKWEDELGGNYDNPRDATNAVAGRIRDRFFRDDPNGAEKSWLLANTPRGVNRERAMRFLMGEGGWQRRIEADVEDLKGIEEGLAKADTPEQRTWARLSSSSNDMFRRLRESEPNRQTDDWWRSVAEFDVERKNLDVEAELDAITDARTALERVSKLGGTQATELRKTGRIRQAVASTETWSSPGKWNMPVKAARAVVQMRPHHVVDITDVTRADNQLVRMLQDAEMSAGDIELWRGRMLDANTYERRWQIFANAENAALRKTAEDFNIAQGDIDELIEKASYGREKVREILRGGDDTSYAPDGRSTVRFTDPDTGEHTMLSLPLTRTQMARSYVPSDMSAVRRKISWAQTKAGPAEGLLDTGAKGLRLGKQTLNTISHYWKPTVLLRPGWTGRVMTDEAFRRMAKFGAQAVALDALKGTRNLLARYGDELRERGYRKAMSTTEKRAWKSRRVDELVDEGMDVGDATAQAVRELSDPYVNKATKAGTGAGAVAGFAFGGPVGAVIGAGGGWSMMKLMDRLDVGGYGRVAVGPHDLDSPFDKAGRIRDQVSQGEHVVGDVVENSRRAVSRRFQSMRNDWQTLTPDMDGYAQAWERAVNDQIGQDALWGRMLAGIEEGRPRAEIIDDSLEWLDTPEGRDLVRSVKDTGRLEGAGEVRIFEDNEWRWVPNDREAWLGQMYDSAEQLVAGDSTIAAAAKRGNATVRQLEEVIPDQGMRPNVHGELLSQTAGTSPVQDAIKGFIEAGFKVLGQAPADELSRMPSFARFYKNYLEDAMDRVDDADMTPQRARSLEEAARNHALGNTRELLYDLAEHSRFSEMARFLMPFWNAGQEVATRWAGLAAESPQVLAYVRKAWMAPEKAGLMREDQRTGEQYISFRVPSMFKKLDDFSPLFRGALDTLDQGKLYMSSLATIPAVGAVAGEESVFDALTAGLFGFGPVVNMSASELVKRKPELEDNLQFMFPYGISDGPVDAFLPAWLRGTRAAIEGYSNDQYAAIFSNMIKTKMIEAHLDGRPFDPTDEQAMNELIAETKRESDSLLALDIVSSFLAPAAPTYSTPYQKYIDEYRGLQERIDKINSERQEVGQPPTTAAALFHEMYGDEFFYLTQSFSRNNTAIPPTVEGKQAFEENQQLISSLNDPELAGLVIGAVGAGERGKFSQAVYQTQFERPISESRPNTPQREIIEPAQLVTEPDVSMGWNKYNRAMARLEAARIDAGLSTIEDSDRLSALKDLVEAQIGSQHPAWAESRRTFSEQDWKARVNDLYDIAQHRRLSRHDAIRGLQTYLEAREQIVRELARRDAAGGAKTLEANSNSDLKRLWDVATARMTMDNPTFHDLYYRWLEGDPVSISSTPSEALPTRKAQ